MQPTSFLFTCCQTGAEAALKTEIAREHPALRFAYSRTGFVTFKQSDGGALDPGFELKSVFARAYGLSTGKTTTADATPIVALARELSELGGGKAPRIHVWERDQHFPGDEPLGFVAGLWEQAAREAILKADPKLETALSGDSLPADGDLVLDVVAVGAEEWWFGYHRHSPFHAPWPGGRPRIVLPADAPSRAYVKLEEAIRWSQAPVKSGDMAVEIGSAPGGASFALIERGLRVVGIDPGEMDPRVLSSRSFKHIKKPVAQVLREELPSQVEWLLLDMNVEPRISMYAVDRLATRLMKGGLLGVFLTIKLNQWRIANEIPSMLDHVKAMGMVRVRATQLPSNRQEILVFGLTQLGLRRRSVVKGQS